LQTTVYQWILGNKESAGVDYTQSKLLARDKHLNRKQFEHSQKRKFPTSATHFIDHGAGRLALTSCATNTRREG